MRDLVESNEFQTALWWGLTALAVTIGLGMLSRRFRDGRPAPVAGLAFAGAGAIAVRATSVLPDDVGLGLALLAGAGIVADVLARPVLAGPGAGREIRT